MSSGRNTRARSRQSGSTTTGDTSGANIRGGAAAAFREPGAADLPGLFPVHDGSYGINTFIGIDAPRRRRTNRQRPPYVDEDEEDYRFTRRLGRIGFPVGLGMAGSATGDPTNTNDQSGKGGESGKGSGSAPGGTSASSDDSDEPTPGDDGDKPAPGGASSTGDGAPPKPPSGPRYRDPGGDDGRPVDDFDSGSASNAHVPSRSQPFGDRKGGPPKPPYTTVKPRSPNPHVLVHNRLPSTLSSSTKPSPFFDMATGRGSFPVTSYRPDSSRSFGGESGLFNNAAVHTPHGPSSNPTVNPTTPPPSSTPGAGAPFLPGSSDMFNKQPGGGPDKPPGGGPDKPPGGGPTKPPGGGPTKPPGGGPTTLPGGGPTILPGGGPTILPGGGPTIPPGAGPTIPPGVGPTIPTEGPNFNLERPVYRPPGLTDGEWLRIYNLIQDMRQAQATSDTVPTLSGLSQKEIDAIRSIMFDSHLNNERALQELLLKALRDVTESQPEISAEESRRRINHLIHDMKIVPGEKFPRIPLENSHMILGPTNSDIIKEMARSLDDANSMKNILRNHSGSRILLRKNIKWNKNYNTPGNIEDTHAILSASDVHGIKAVVGNQAEADRIVALLKRHPQSLVAFPKPTSPTLDEKEISRRIKWLIHDMAVTPPPPPAEHPPIVLPDNLTRRQLEVMRWMIPDLSSDRVYAQKMAEALDEALKNAPPDSPLNDDDGAAPLPPPPPPPGIPPPGILPPGIPPKVDGIRDIPDWGVEPDAPPPVALRRRRRPGMFAVWGNRSLVFFTVLFLIWALIWALLSGLSRQGGPADDIFQPEESKHWQLPGWNGITGGISQIPTKVRNLLPDLRSRRPKGKDVTVAPTEKTGSPKKPKDVGKTKPDDPIGEIIEDIYKRLPEETYVTRGKHGKIQISEDFWHALKELMQNDEVILTLKNAKTAPEISEEHWEAVKKRVEQLSSSSTSSTETPSGTKWEAWVRQNKDRLKELFRTGKTDDKSGAALSKDEFIKVFREEIQTYQDDIRKEFATRDGQIHDLVSTVERLREIAKDITNLSEKEIRDICDQAVKKAIQRVKADALSDGCIKGATKDLFENSINFFTVGLGATIEPHSSSPGWKIPKNYYTRKSKEWFHQMGYQPQPQVSAIMPWTEEGECFCTGPSVKGKREETNAISVLISRFVVPQHLVVEHILPGATLDPGSRPKDIEMWMYIEELNLREEVQAFSLREFPNTPKETMLNEGFVKVGHFTYDDVDHGDGSQIFKLSDQLATMGASSMNFVVRAISNYGADHTCFYRLRMYGDIADVRPWENFKHYLPQV
ncbi:hypothetical protein F4821DRAFT_240028 [Hypoxylon rubiginosum]|uniref:Uncharacterized protein n=1 Tax=Hypoxylon rubiginosum TaxID=110542 RepID=A0ACC0CZQ4_9PEZI|nr:hypothetical protein F4821DRAFT_240028 [Hypoxylon rubiginosum]